MTMDNNNKEGDFKLKFLLKIVDSNTMWLIDLA